MSERESLVGVRYRTDEELEYEKRWQATGRQLIAERALHVRVRAQVDALTAEREKIAAALPLGEEIGASLPERVSAVIRRRDEQLEAFKSGAAPLVETLGFFIDTVERAVAAHRAPKIGLHVPYMGDFANITPSVAVTLERWIKRIKISLDAYQQNLISKK